MSVTLLYHPQDLTAANIVSSALVRSFSAAQVRCAGFNAVDVTTRLFSPSRSQIYVLLNPTDAERGVIDALRTQRRKIIVLGTIGTSLATDIGLEVEPLGADADSWSVVQPFTDEGFAASQAEIVYKGNHPLTAGLSLRDRPLSRYDFTDEWNTLGFGRITVDGSIWSLCQQAKPTHAQAIAEIIRRKGESGKGKSVSVYAAIAETDNHALLWFNRAVGPVDSLEWRLIETFCSEYRADDLACIPYLSEVPDGYKGTVTMRLDCDQAIATARPLFELYEELGLPLSLAIVTGLPPQPNDMAFLRDVLAHGGAVVSHSHTHPPNWGKDASAALSEAQQSKVWLEQHLPETAPVHYAVSPFHQNPPYAVNALAEAGYLGFVGGIIHNDPEYLMGRSGQAPLCDRPLVSHSQQCMLHGDCFHQYGHSMQPYCDSFKHHLEAGHLFGYLDHPFSSTYQYGWDTEAERLAAHAELIRFIQSHEDIWFPNLVQCLEFVRKRSLCSIDLDDTQSLRVRWQPTQVALEAIPSIQVSWRGANVPVFN